MSRKDNNPLVSILVPLYNSENYVLETLDSCMNQTYKNIEVVVVDDGSSDNSLSVVKHYIASQSQIEIYTQKNSGACRARNFAFEKSHGIYIMYLDADDLLTENFVEKQVERLSGFGDDSAVFCEWHKLVKGEMRYEKNRKVYHDYPTGIELAEDLLNGNMLQTSCWMVPREVVEKAGPWKEDLLINQDGEFFMRVLANVKYAFYTPGCMVKYRCDNMGSISKSSLNVKKGFSLLDSYLSTYNYFKERNILTQRLAYGLARSILSVAYINANNKDVVCAVRKQYNERFDLQTAPLIGGKNFQKGCALIGFWNMLKLKQLFGHG